MNKENNTPALRARNLNQNSGYNANETSSLKTLIKENVTTQQHHNPKRISIAEKNVNNGNNENARENSTTTEGGLRDAQKVPTWVSESWNRFAIVDSEPSKDFIKKVTKDSRFGTPVNEQTKSTTAIEQSPVSEHTNYKEAKESRMDTAQTKLIQELKQKVSELKQQNNDKKEILAKTVDSKNKFIKAEKVRKSHIEELKQEIAEKEEIQEELLSILKPIEEKSSLQRLKQKQELVIELLNTLSFLNFEISELQENA